MMSDTKDTLNRAKRPESPKGESEAPRGQKVDGMGPGDEGQHVKEAAAKDKSQKDIDKRLAKLEEQMAIVVEELSESSLGFLRRQRKAGSK